MSLNIEYPHNLKIVIEKEIVYDWHEKCGNNMIFINKSGDRLNPNTVWEYPVIDFFIKQLEKKPDMIVLDIGAQIGLYSLVGKFFPKSKFYSFEPFKYSFDLLNRNIKFNKIENIKTFNYGLSNKKEKKILYVPKFSSDRKSGRGGLNSLGNCSNSRINIENCDKVSINTDTIDNLFINTAIDYIKIDTEGWEYFILEGGLKTILKYKPLIQIEWNAQNMKQCGVKEKHLIEFFNNINYKKFVDLGEEIVYISN